MCGSASASADQPRQLTAMHKDEAIVLNWALTHVSKAGLLMLQKKNLSLAAMALCVRVLRGSSDNKIRSAPWTGTSC